ncbi:MAG: hypothetical protein HKN36_00250 [Hellea sp.]|nr:hypothetical protein [Hellea sp.]
MPQQDLIRQIRQLCRKYTESGDPQLLSEIRDLRIVAGKALESPQESIAPIIDVPDLFSNCRDRLPEIEADKLNKRALQSAVQHHGALIIRNLVSPEKSAELRECLDQAFAAFTDSQTGSFENTSEWLDIEIPDKRKILRMGAMSIMFKYGALWTFLSPKTLERVIALFDDMKLKPVLRNYFGDRPCLSFNKSVIRRMEPLTVPSDWHQDGAFMTGQVKSLNCWIALNECGAGTDSPGMDFIPKRFNHVVETGKNKARYDWTIAPDTVKEKFKETPAVRPRFGEGDAVFFDHLCLHSTSFDPAYTRRRYAIETWFFSQQYAPENQKPAIW